MRLFVAIDLSNEVKDYLFSLQAKLKNNKLAKVNWIAKKNLHLTMKFLGEVPNDNVKDIISKLKNIKYKKFNLSLSGLGVYPNNFRVNVVWVGVSPVEKVVELQKLVDTETLDFGDLKFGGHITLGRVKFVANKTALLEKLNKVEVDKLSFEVNSFILFNSVLSKDGPSYKVLVSYYLV